MKTSLLLLLALAACAPDPLRDASTLAEGTAVAPVLLTNANRNAPTMSGGWGPHLRGIMTMDDGKEWFAAETGGDVNANTALMYYRKDDAGWKAVGSVALYAGIQQNMATVSNGRYLYSYGVNAANNWIMECWFDTKAPGFNRQTCNKMFSIAPASNYVGAALRKDGTRVVWWTKVGSSGSAGTFSYTYNHGGGWNGPVTSGLQGYNDVGYVHGSFDALGRLRVIGQLWLGAYPGGSPHAAVATIKLASGVVWTPIAGATSSSDIWHDEATGTTHVLAVVQGGVAYYAAKAAQWPALGSRVATYVGTGRARFAPGASGGLRFLRDDVPGNVLVDQTAPASLLGAAIAWSQLPATAHPRSGAVAGQPLSAIWTPDPSKERNVARAKGFATGGSYPSNDHQVWHYP